MSEVESPQPTNLVEVADIAAERHEWPEWVVESVDEDVVVRARNQCRPNSRAQDALTDLLGRVRKEGESE